MTQEFGNAGSRTHSYGQVAKERVNRAREEVAAVVAAKPDEVIFTSGATESDNLAILGLACHGEATGKKHIISTQIEHKAVLEPLELLAERGFEVELLTPNAGGWVPSDVGRSRTSPRHPAGVSHGGQQRDRRRSSRSRRSPLHSPTTTRSSTSTQPRRSAS